MKDAPPVDERDDARRAQARRAKMANAVRPTAEEDAAITAAALADPDNPPLTERELAQLKPARPRGRPAVGHTKEPTTMRVDTDVLDAFKATGDGWQSRMNAALRQHVLANGMLVRRYRATVHRPGDEQAALDEFIVVASDAAEAMTKVRAHLRQAGLDDAASDDVRMVESTGPSPRDVPVLR